MRRYGKFVDAVWIHHRMRLKDARFERDHQRRPLASALMPTSLPHPRFLVGDTVQVTNDARVGEREVVLACGEVEAITGEYPDQRYVVRGVEGAQGAATLRLVLRGGAQ